MQVIDENRRQLIAEVIEVHYRCPECGYELIIPEPVEKRPTNNKKKLEFQDRLRKTVGSDDRRRQMDHPQKEFKDQGAIPNLKSRMMLSSQYFSKTPSFSLIMVMYFYDRQ